jgi:microfibrillar-associated protein 1
MIFENTLNNRNTQDSDLEKIRVSFKKIKRYRRGVLPDWFTPDNIKHANYHYEECQNERKTSFLKESKQIFKSANSEYSADGRLPRFHLTETIIRPEDIKTENTQMSWDSYKSKDSVLEKVTNQNVIVNKEKRILETKDIGISRLNKKEFDFLERKAEKLDEKFDDISTKPKTLFISKDQRNTLIERYKLQQRHENIKKEEECFKQNRNNETLKKIEKISTETIETIAKSTSDVSRQEDICTDDDVDEEGEFECWKKREIERLNRDKNELDKMERDKQITTHTHSTFEDEKEKYAEVYQRRESSKMKFLQKFYHKGAFFQEDSDDKFGTANSHLIYKRDFSGPTEEDNFDKTLLPVVMQVKNFGRRGRTKWTHLVSEDTSNRDLVPITLMKCNCFKKINLNTKK